MTVKCVFDVHPDDKFACMADIGWITSHILITIFESTPVYPMPSKHWQTVEKHRLTQFYSTPTTICLLCQLGAHHVEGHNLSTLQAWNWYKEECTIVNTFWQTETGSIVMTPFPGAIETKPGSTTVPFFGIDPFILDPMSRMHVQELEGNDIKGVLALSIPWPSIAHTIYGNHKCYLETYMKLYPGLIYTGDGAAHDEHSHIWIQGLIDYVINVPGHCLSMSKIESTLIMHKGVAETAVIGAADELTSQAMAFTKELVLQVWKVIGPFAVLKKTYIVSNLPKTCNGQIMCCIMHKLTELGMVDIIKNIAESA
ncbi:acetyl-CoA synthetase-like protein [Armillaria gallica]|uniref:acetate--CoA ligase n=1 Tax=Armillaria gallica TaxID=47427 RepID=A0A2H3D1G9_ARMGA|nr:acetyl-CoA synthetase-like protein [Armillaria gallica]